MEKSILNGEMTKMLVELSVPGAHLLWGGLTCITLHKDYEPCLLAKVTNHYFPQSDTRSAKQKAQL